jgi:class 3 adenylate cyclase
MAQDQLAASVGDIMKSVESWLGLIGGVIAIVGALIALARHWWTIEHKLEQTGWEAERRALNESLGKVEGQLSQLRNQVAMAGRAGSIALNLKSRLDDLLVEMMGAFGASGGSIYVPVSGPSGAVHGLTFLSIEPFNRQNQALKAKIIPMRSLAGRCFESGESSLITNSANDDSHFQAAEKIANYKPSTTLNFPLKSDKQVVGVLQMLRREGEAPFEQSDLDQLEALSKDLIPIVRDILKNPEAVAASTAAAEKLGTDGTALFFDLSNSAVIFKEFPASFALQLLNEYFEQMCNVGFKHGGTLDNYMGDGALMRFNVPRSVPDHARSAVSAALEMRDLFPSIKDYWVEINPIFSSIQFRAGIATGPMLQAMVGHSLVQNLTVIGLPLTIASSLCDLGPRDRSVILASGDTAMALDATVKTRAFALPKDSKAARTIDEAFEIIDMA